MTTHQISEIILLAFSAGLSWFCFSLSRKVKNLNNLESGLGGAIAVMISEVERLERAIHEARNESAKATRSLASEIERAKEERAFWALQQQFGSVQGAEAKMLTRRRQRKQEAAGDA